MKNYCLLLLSISTIIACSKEEKQTILGRWDAQSIQTRLTNQIVTSIDTIFFEIDFKENGEGISSEYSGNEFREIHWVVDELENKAFIINSFIVQNGEEIFSTSTFDMERNSSSEQIWNRRTYYTSSITGDLNEYLERWTLTK